MQKLITMKGLCKSRILTGNHAHFPLLWGSLSLIQTLFVDVPLKKSLCSLRFTLKKAGEVNSFQVKLVIILCSAIAREVEITLQDY